MSAYFLKAKITIEAEGYWFTLGGDKGTRGYYSHLVDADGYPCYPATQIHNNLRVACKWLAELENDESKRSAITGQIRELFGPEPKNDTSNQVSSLIRFSDLELSQKDKQTKTPNDIFQLQPIIKINTETRTVEDKNLAFYQCAYIDGLTLEADLWIGPVAEESKLNSYKELLEESITLYLGTAGSRSRGMGKGKMGIQFEETQEIKIETTETNVINAIEVKDSYEIILKNLTPFHNPNPLTSSSSEQVEKTIRYITGEQFRAWFARIYKEVSGGYLMWTLLIFISHIYIPTKKKNSLFLFHVRL